MKIKLFFICFVCFCEIVSAQKPSTFTHIEISSGFIFGNNINPSPYIPMLRVGPKISVDNENHQYIVTHAGIFWGNPGIGCLIDASYQVYLTTISNYGSLFFFPEGGYSHVWDPSNGGSGLVGLGIALGTSYLEITIRGLYFWRTEYGMAQIGFGIKF